MTDRLLPCLAGAAAACADAGFVTEGVGSEPFFVVSGPVDPAVDASGEALRAAIAWVVWSDGALSGRVDEAPFEPRVLAYALSVTGPPEPASAGVPYPPLDGTRGTLSFGLPILVAGRGPVDVEVDAEALADWMLGASTSLGDALASTGSGRVVAATRAHALAVASAVTAPADGACRAGALVAGLTLYRDEGTGCDGWQPIAPPGERTEFQGIGMAPAP